MHCPVCPYPDVADDVLACPACGTDLAALQRVRELPLVLLNDGWRHAAGGALDDATASLRAAAAFPRTRGRSLLLLGACEARRGRLGEAARCWEAATRDGDSTTAATAAARLRRARTLAAECTFGRSAGRITCPNVGCAHHGATGRGNVHLVRVYGADAIPLWRCRACGARFSGNRRRLVFRARVPHARAYRVVAGLLAGKAPGQVAAEEACSPATVRRLGTRAARLGPEVVHEVAAGLHRPVASLRRGWAALVQRYGPSIG